MAEHARVIRVAKFRPDPGVREEVLARLQQIAQELRSLPGLFGAQVCRLHEDPSWLVLVSRWESEQAMSGTNAPPIAEHIRSLAGLVEREEIEHLIAL